MGSILLNYIIKEWNVLKGAPISFVGLAVLSLISGLALASWHYGERLNEQDGQLRRYRVALGIEKASGGALVELNNAELATKAQSIAAQLRKLDKEWKAKNVQLQELMDSGKISLDDGQAAKHNARQIISEDFDKDLASDADNVDNELRKRLSPEAISHIVRVPGFAESEGVAIPLTALLRGKGFDVFYISGLAAEMEEMANLLAPDSSRH